MVAAAAGRRTAGGVAASFAQRADTRLTVGDPVGREVVSVAPSGPLMSNVSRPKAEQQAARDASVGVPLRVLLRAVVGCFLRNRDVMRMTLSGTRCRNLNETRFRTQFLDGWRAAISHSGAKPSN